jgi:hypothetical protein
MNMWRHSRVEPGAGGGAAVVADVIERDTSATVVAAEAGAAPSAEPRPVLFDQDAC